MNLITGKFSEQDIDYFDNGNIKAFKRTGYSSAFFDELSYNYYDGTDLSSENQLKNVVRNTISQIPGSNLDQSDYTLNYVYNDIGQMIYNYKDNQYIEYNNFGKVATIWNTSKTRKKADFIYDANGHKIKKMYYEDNTLNLLSNITYYITSASGVVLRTIDYNPFQSGTITEHFETPIYGLGRIGLRYSTNTIDDAHFTEIQSTNTVVYEITDHLGNVRVTFRKDPTGGGCIINSFADYYPMGLCMDGRQLISADNYRYGYQGQFSEKSNETGYNEFEFRMYDPRLGRWMTVDRAHQHWSPYLAMSNKWSMHVDPNGFVDWDQVRGGLVDMGFGALEMTVSTGVLIGTDGVAAPVALPAAIDGASQFAGGLLNLASGILADPNAPPSITTSFSTTIPGQALQLYYLAHNLFSEPTALELEGQANGVAFVDLFYDVASFDYKALASPSTYKKLDKVRKDYDVISRALLANDFVGLYVSAFKWANSSLSYQDREDKATFNNGNASVTVGPINTSFNKPEEEVK